LLRSMVIVNEAAVNTTSDVAAALTPHPNPLPGQRLSILGAISHTVESSYQSRDGKMIQPIATRWRR
jgi:hypothetical protein